MIDLDEVRREVERLEAAAATYGNCEKLAVLYTIQDHHAPVPSTSGESYSGYSYAAEPESEFVLAARSAPFEQLLSVLDEHMDAIQIVAPKEYRALMRKIEEFSV